MSESVEKEACESVAGIIEKLLANGFAMKPEKKPVFAAEVGSLIDVLADWIEQNMEKPSERRAA